jgi:hypothetical protein
MVSPLLHMHLIFQMIRPSQIEKATLLELDWALANLGGSKAKKQSKNSEDWVADADAKGSKEDVRRLLLCLSFFG